MRLRFTFAALTAVGLLVPARRAIGVPDAPHSADESDRYDLSIRSESYLELFRRALLPGPNGTIVATDTVAPVHQYLRLRALDVDTGWREDSIDIELAAFGRAWFGEPDFDRRFDGDVQAAHVSYEHGPIGLRLGRQEATGGAARYVRFDGLALDANLGAGFVAGGYAGLTALPRWDGQPGYQHLGSAADSLLRDPNALPEPERSGYKLGGGRFGWTAERGQAAVSFHEQHQPGGLTRRTLGLDARAFLLRNAALGGSGLVELDARRIQDARLWVDATPARAMDLSVEYLHTEPALFLSRQSVLSVFSTDAYDEAGGSTIVQVTDRFALEGNGFIELYDDGRRGARSEIAARILPGAGTRTFVRVAYARVVALDNGYHALRASLSRRLLPVLLGTLEAYSYLYDDAILGRTTSEVYVGTLSYQAAEALNLLWGASLAQSPYAEFDAQTLLRVIIDFDHSTWSGAR